MGMTLPTAEVVSFWSNWLLLASLLVGVAATYLIIISGNVKESALKAEVAEAHERTAKANKIAAQAQLELARLTTPRSLDNEQRQKLRAKLSGYVGQEFSRNVFPDPEAIGLLRVIDGVLKDAGWKLIPSQVGDIVTEDAGHANDVGVQVGISPHATPAVRELAVFLAKSLTEEGLQATPNVIQELKIPQAININVGKKP